MKLTVTPRAESVVSAARYFAAGNEALVYAYTCLIRPMLETWHDEGTLVDIVDLLPTDLSWLGVEQGVWWWVGDGKHGYQDYVLGFLAAGDSVLLATSFSGDYRFSEFIYSADDDVALVNPKFDIRRWHAAMEDERRCPASVYRDPIAGVEDRLGRWYEDQYWDPLEAVKNANTAGARRMVAYLDERQKGRW